MLRSPILNKNIDKAIDYYERMNDVRVLSETFHDSDIIPYWDEYQFKQIYITNSPDAHVERSVFYNDGYDVKGDSLYQIDQHYGTYGFIHINKNGYIVFSGSLVSAVVTNVVLWGKKKNIIINNLLALFKKVILC